MSMETEIDDMKKAHEDEVAALQKDLDQAKSRLAESARRRKPSESSEQQQGE